METPFEDEVAKRPAIPIQGAALRLPVPVLRGPLLYRHVGFLVGSGYPAGDSSCLPQTVESVLPLQRRPLPHRAELLGIAVRSHI
jgi:hypothetical protein